MSTTPTTPQIPPPVSDSLMRWLKNMQAHMVYHGPSSDFISLGDAIRRLEYLESKFNSAPSPAAHPPITPAAPLTTSSQVTGNCNPAEPAAKAGEINRTPRTDAICKDYAGPLCMIGDQQFIPALFARQLERDLAARDAELARLKQVGARNQYESECFHALCARLWLAVGPDPEKIPGDTCDAKLANMLQTATERAERAVRERDEWMAKAQSLNAQLQGM